MIRPLPLSLLFPLLLPCACLVPAAAAQETTTVVPATPVQSTSAPQPTQVPDDELFVLPGTFLSEHTTLAELQARYGAANVRTRDPASPARDGAPDATLFPDDPTRRASVWFWGGEFADGIASIQVDDRESRWRGKLGLRIGMSMAEVQALNGKPFGYQPTEGAAGGSVHDHWSPCLDDDDCTAGAFDVADDEQMYFEVDFAPRSGEPVPADAYPQGFETVRSNDPRYPLLGDLFEVTSFGARTSLDDEW